MMRRSTHTVGAALALLSVTAASAIGLAAIRVVPVAASLAGLGRTSWLALSWQRALDRAGPARACDLVRVGRHLVLHLSQPAADTTVRTYACSAPAGGDVYVDQAGSECSTLPHNHDGYGTTPGDLGLCARRALPRDPLDTTVDGEPVTSPTVTTGAFTVHAVKGNPFGITPGKGRAVAAGGGLLLGGLARGRHVIRTTVRFGKGTLVITWNVRVP